MSEKIKVWAAVCPIKGVLSYTASLARGEVILRVKSATRSGWEKLQNEGWTVQPYTLTKGHDNE